MSDFQIISQKIKEIAKDLTINPESLTQDRTEFLFDDEKAQNDVEANIQVNINESAYEGNGNSFIGNVVDSIATLFGVSSSEIKDDTGNKLATVTQENDTTIRIIREKDVSTDKLNMPDKSDEYAGKTVIVDRHDKDKDYRKIYVYDKNGYS